MTDINQDIARAVQILTSGGLVAFPTETVYGLGADASNESAVKKVFEVKGRPADHPLIVHLSSINQLEQWAKDIPPVAMTLAKAFWPGPLTLVLKKRPGVLDCVTGGQETVAVRIPRHPVAQALLSAFGKGLVAPSANRFTRISPTTATAVEEELGKSVDLILNGGSCEVGLESTIIDVSRERPIILRPGMITAAQIGSLLGALIDTAYREKSTTRVPGMHHLHYSPVTPAKLVATADIAPALQKLTAKSLPLVCMAYSNKTFPAREGVHWVTMPMDAKTYAHELYRVLRSLDQQGYKKILIEAVPETAEWEAIRDRLNKATGIK